MHSHTSLKIIRYLSAVLISAITFASFLFVQAEDSLGSTRLHSTEEEDLSVMQEQARSYRVNGIEFQKTGDIDTAKSLYQKAIQLDPAYAAAYNDLGVIYEAEGSVEKAKEHYLKALILDRYYLSAYTNLALLYEEDRDFMKAASFWRRRIEFGLSGEYWTERAKKRLRDIELVMPEESFIGKGSTETEVIDLTREVLSEKYIIREDDAALSEKFFKKAKASYEMEEYAAALWAAVDAYLLDPANKEIEQFIQKVQSRALLR
ncbi:MAG: tetratricopeptide repeat protein [Candidatus Omnitrophica bacterium]|nr:tetratricopeptide repeat protein [Candidatus Omnitrophota bacterium]MBU1905598.1 tetratricopeptide repeat protein [Candidatus Omnitrophota bacterium]